MNTNVENQKRKHVISLEGPKVFIFAFSSSIDKEKWVNAINTGSSKKPVENPPNRENLTTKKKSLGARAKNKMAGDLASSGIGKKLMKSVLNEDSLALLNSMKKITSELDGKKKADEFEKNVIKLVVKGYLLVEAKKISEDAFLQTDKPLREAFELMIKIYRRRDLVKPEAVLDALYRVETSLKQVEIIVTELLQSYLTPKNMFKLASSFSYMCSFGFLEKAFTDHTLDESMDKLIDAMEYYTQFHF